MTFYLVEAIYDDYPNDTVHELGIYAALEKAFSKVEEYTKESFFRFDDSSHLLIKKYELAEGEYKTVHSWLKNKETNWEWEEANDEV